MKVLKRPVQGFTLIELMIVIAIIAILTTILLPNFVRVRSQGRLTGCKTNMRNIATAVQVYAVENASRYPTTLTILPTTRAISAIPTCPSAGNNLAYINGYVASSNPDAYTIVCTGNNHGELNIPACYPQYTGQAGYQEKP